MNEEDISLPNDLEFRKFDDTVAFRGSGKDFFDYMTNYIFILIFLFLPAFFYLFFNLFKFFRIGDVGEVGIIFFAIFFCGISYAIGKIPNIAEVNNKSNFEICQNGIKIKSKKHYLFIEKSNIDAFRVRNMGRYDFYCIYLITCDPIRIGKSIFKRSVFRILYGLSEEDANNLVNKINRILDIRSY